MLWPILLSLAVVAQASSSGEDQHPLISLSHDSNNTALAGEAGEASVPRWNCTLRGWVRAPDLSPSSTLPGEARLAANGTECGDIQSWAVGLRFKERAIVKLRNASIVDFPTRPIRKPYNASADQARMSVDYEDIFQSQGMYIPHKQDEYDIAMVAYNLAIAKPDLWVVEGVERQVFDIQKDLPLGPNASADGVDLAQSFHVHTPATNFPPIEDTTYSGHVIKDADQQLLNAESLFEYYLNVTLANGTSIDVPAGRAGFIPMPVDLPLREWPISRIMDSPRLKQKTKEEHEYEWMMKEPEPPKCDANSTALFNLTLSTVPIITPGENITLHLTLTRRGNGSEHPSVLNVHFDTEKDLDWARSRADATASGSYDELQSARSKRKRGSARYRFSDYGAGKMLKIRTRNQLETDRDRREKAMNGGSQGGSWSSGPHRGPLRTGDGRYDFENDGEVAVRDKYNFSVEIQVPHNVLPSFNGTFHSFQPRLRFNLHTVFLCDVLPVPAPLIAPAADVNITAQRDAEWTEAELPVRVKPNRPRRDHSGLTHTTVIDVDVSLPPPATSIEPVVAYTDASALAPFLSLDDGKPVDTVFQVLNQTIIHETAAQLKSSRYNRGRDFGRYMHCEAGVWGSASRGRCNIGGRMGHAAKLWQGKEILAELKREVELGVKGKVEHAAETQGGQADPWGGFDEVWF